MTRREQMSREEMLSREADARERRLHQTARERMKVPSPVACRQCSCFIRYAARTVRTVGPDALLVSDITQPLHRYDATNVTA